MPALVAGIHVSVLRQDQDVDARHKAGHDDGEAGAGQPYGTP
jgi:hypothetical protein